MQKPFLIYQNAVLELDFEQERVLGRTSLWVGQQHKEGAGPPTRLNLMSRQCAIHSVTVNKQPAPFRRIDPLTKLLPNETYPRNGKQLDILYRAGLEVSVRGELEIDLPAGGASSATELPPLLPAPTASNPIPPSVVGKMQHVNHAIQHLDDTDGYIYQVEIQYELQSPVTGLRFVHSGDLEYLFTSYGFPLQNVDGVRCWLPCMDESHQRGIFDISLIAPEGMDVACTGERVLQQPTGSGTVIHRFVTGNRLPARAVGFFVGRVQRHLMRLYGAEGQFWVPVSALERAEAHDADVEGVVVSDDARVNPHIARKVQHTTLGFDRAVRFIHKFCQRHCNQSNFTLIFVPDLGQRYAAFQGVAVLPDTHLYSEREIDPEVPSHLTQVSGYLMSWLLGAFPLASYQDEWLIHGVLGYLLTLYVEHAYGADDARYRFLKLHDTVIAFERQGLSYVLRNTDFFEHHERATPLFQELLRCKATVLMHMVDHRMPKEHDNLMAAISRTLKAPEIVRGGQSKQDEPRAGDGSTHPDDSMRRGRSDSLNMPDSPFPGFARTNSVTTVTELGPDMSLIPPSPKPGEMLPPMPLLRRQTSVLSEVGWSPTELAEECHTTESFMTLVRACAGGAGGDLTGDFIRQWVDQSGALFIRCGVQYDKRHTNLQASLQQIGVRNGKVSETNSYNGTVTIKVVEADETYQKDDIVLASKTFTHRIHTVSRLRRRRRRDGQDGVDEPRGGGGGGDEPALHRARSLHSSHVLFADLDPAYMWIHQVSILQHDAMWLEQLWMDGVWGQVQALRDMARPRGASRNALLRLDGMLDCLLGKDVVEDFVHHFYIRCEAAYALAAWQNAHAPMTAVMSVPGSWQGLDRLHSACQNMFFSPVTDLPEPNYFNDDDSYAVQKACIVALSRIRALNQATPEQVVELLLKFAVNSDNTYNPVDDSYYVCVMLSALARVRFSSHSPVVERQMHDIIDVGRLYLERDRILPSPNGVTTAAAIECLGEMDIQKGGDWSIDYESYLQEQHPYYVRLAALQALMRIHVARDIAAVVASPTRDAFAPVGDDISPIGVSRALSLAFDMMEAPSLAPHRSSIALVLNDVLQDRMPLCCTRMLSMGEPLACCDWPDSLAIGVRVPTRYQREIIGLLRRRDARLAQAVARWCAFISDETKFDQSTRSMLLMTYVYVWERETPPCLLPDNLAGFSDDAIDDFFAINYAPLPQSLTTIPDPAVVDSAVEDALCRGPEYLRPRPEGYDETTSSSGAPKKLKFIIA